MGYGSTQIFYCSLRILHPVVFKVHIVMYYVLKQINDTVAKKSDRLMEYNCHSVQIHSTNLRCLFKRRSNCANFQISMHRFEVNQTEFQRIYSQTNRIWFQSESQSLWKRWFYIAVFFIFIFAFCIEHYWILFLSILFFSGLNKTSFKEKKQIWMHLSDRDIFQICFFFRFSFKAGNIKAWDHVLLNINYMLYYQSYRVSYIFQPMMLSHTLPPLALFLMLCVTVDSWWSTSCCMEGSTLS